MEIIFAILLQLMQVISHTGQCTPPASIRVADQQGRFEVGTISSVCKFGTWQRVTLDVRDPSQGRVFEIHLRPAAKPDPTRYDWR